jgi:hypothetical protein
MFEKRSILISQSSYPSKPISVFRFAAMQDAYLEQGHLNT